MDDMSGAMAPGLLSDMSLPAAPDAGMRRFARLTARFVGVPSALVALVEGDSLVFPCVVGPAAHFAADGKQAALVRELSRRVVTSGAPVVLEDVRAGDPNREGGDDPGAAEVVSYAGEPLKDAMGRPLGALCAVDATARRWTESQLGDLADLAAACSAELRLRVTSLRATGARNRAQVLTHQVRQDLNSAELLLRAAEELTGAASVQEVNARVRDLLSADLKPSYVSLLLLNGRELRRLPDPDSVHPGESVERMDRGADFAAARALRERRMVTVADRADVVRNHGPEAVAAFDSLGISSAVCLPMVASRGPVGVLGLGWDSSHEVTLDEAAVLTTIAGYTAQAVERAVFLDDRIHVAHQLQQAMLTDLPTLPGMDIAALYRPASADDMVGGDWYDAFPLPHPHGDRDPGVAVTVGDITGHDIRAAALMGQVRSMLRQSVLIKNGEGPASALAALEYACRVLPLPASGTLIHAHIHHENDQWTMTWTNAGHPPPLLLHPDRHVSHLTDHGPLLHHGLPATERHDSQVVLEPGSTLLLYTDGLIERPGSDLDSAIDHAAALLAAGATAPLPDLLERLADQVACAHADDDTVLLALRIPPREQPATAGPS
ncbi:SpoIIE family protein phosphatase [Streptomyces sp. NBC_01198]|uniref:SpoIIE family protein phosphatase n=1 Tax=Streptomyces sp. NBC_01198 TaxID=2903769 RepID=UPI002E154C2A|nr:SpoIIE family protein phosphatase [Streptomyces sp. NBC_01198]